MNRNSNIDQAIAKLKPSQALVISQINDTLFCTAEKSGDGQTLRFVRHDGDTYTTFRQVRL